MKRMVRRLYTVSQPGPGTGKGRTVDGHHLTCGAIGDHGVKFGRPPTVHSYQKDSTLRVMLNSSLES